MRICIFTLALMVVAVAVGCKKDDVLTYQVILSTEKPLYCTTLFTEITYIDANRKIVTVTNQSTDFKIIIPITEGFPISFSVKGTVSNSNPNLVLPPVIRYEVNRFTNGKEKFNLCKDVEGSFTGSGTTVPFSMSLNRVFSTTDCR